MLGEVEKMSKNNRKNVNNISTKQNKNTGFGRFMFSIVVLGVVILLFINFALPLMKKKVSHVAAEKTVEMILADPEMIAGDNKEIKKVLESMTDEDKEVVAGIIENHMDAETVTEVMGYVNSGDKEAIMKYVSENLSVEETMELIQMYGKYSDTLIDSMNSFETGE